MLPEIEAVNQPNSNEHEPHFTVTLLSSEEIGTLISICGTHLSLLNSRNSGRGVGLGPSTILIMENKIRFCCLFA